MSKTVSLPYIHRWTVLLGLSNRWSSCAIPIWNSENILWGA